MVYLKTRNQRISLVRFICSSIEMFKESICKDVDKDPNEGFILSLLWKMLSLFVSVGFYKDVLI